MSTMKKNIIKKAGLAALLITPFSTQSLADDGLYLSVYAKNSTLEHTIERNTGSNTTPSITTQAQESDFGYGLGVGYKMHIDEDAFVDVEAFYNSEDVQTRNLNNLLITQVSLESTYGLKLKAGFDVNDKFALYGFIGNTWLDIDLHNSYPFAPPMRQGSETESEVSFGFGATYEVSNNVAVVYEYSQIQDVDFNPLPEVAVPGKINPNDLDLSSWKLGLKYSF